MNVVERSEDTITFHHLGHAYRLRMPDCKYGEEPDGREADQFLLTPEMVCVRDDCPECAKAAEEREIPDYRTPAQTCFPLFGDSEAMEMHLRYRVAGGRDMEEVFRELEGQMPDAAAQARLEQARRRILGEANPYPLGS